MSATSRAAAQRGRLDVPDHTRVVVAMSGGVDSSVAAALLVEQGIEVIGISLRLAADPSAGARSSGCCSLDDFRDAAKVADTLGIAHYVLDMREAFHRSVVTPFVEEYLAGRTPSPCVLCNREIKFGLLHAKARELGANVVATGHYAVRERCDGRYRLLRGRDPAKDQSYFLFEMGQHELASTLFPVGGLQKDEVRRIAAESGLSVAEKPESQEICFVPDGRYADFVARAAPERVRPGYVRDQEGAILGRHDGVHRFTVGQRRGLGIAAAAPIYVDRIDAETATVVTAPLERTTRIGLVADGARWISGTAEPHGARVDVRIRHRHRPVAAWLEAASPSTFTLRFDEPQAAVTPGQAAVLYRGDEVLGGGWISRALDEASASRTMPAGAACE
jgi:tRNA-specific 2-thiouridylase